MGYRNSVFAYSECGSMIVTSVFLANCFISASSPLRILPEQAPRIFMGINLLLGIGFVEFVNRDVIEIVD
jgi:hypothetical protein